MDIKNLEFALYTIDATPDNSYSPFCQPTGMAILKCTFQTMDEIAKIILSAKRRRFLRSHPVFEPFKTAPEAELFRLAKGLNFKFPLGLSKWLRLAGYGDIDGVLSFREEFFSKVDCGPLDGLVTFAQDSGSNCFAFNPKNDSIYYIHRPEQTAVRISDDFPSFLQELIRRDYKLPDWVGSLSKAK